MAAFDISQQPSPAGIGKPGSGTYGEGAALDRLKKAFPTAPPAAGPGGPTGPPPMPTPSPGPLQAPAPGGVPAGILAPTRRPDVPGSTPLAGPPVSPMQATQTGRQRTMTALDGLVNDPNTSEATRQWARDLIAHLIQSSAR